jgi:hypothetical protein
MRNKILIFSEIEWYFLKQRHQFLAEYLQNENYEVHFIQKVPSRVPEIKVLINYIIKNILRLINKKTNGKKSEPCTVKLHHSILMPQTNKLFRVYNKYIAANYYAEMARNGTIYTFSPSIYEIVRKSKTHNFKVIFDIVHNWWEMPWGNQISRKASTDLLKEANEVICDSKPLAEHLKLKYQISNIHIVLPGVNTNWIEDFTKDSRNAEAFVNNSGIVFFGNLRENSDIQLFKSLIQSGMSIDAYGNVTPEIRSELDGMVEFKGPLIQDELITALQGYEYTLLPYANDSFSKWISPAKYFEVLALGKPILSRSKLSHMPGWNRLCHNINIDDVKDSNSICSQLKEISEKHSKYNNREFGQQIAKNNIWENQLKKISDIISLCNR